LLGAVLINSVFNSSRVIPYRTAAIENGSAKTWNDLVKLGQAPGRGMGKASLASKIELNAGNQLAKMENGTQGAHYYSRHGAQTTLDEQYTRATTGVTPDGFAGRTADSSRFLSNQAQLNAAQRAETIYQQTGKTNITFDTGEIIGEGYLKGGGDLVRTTNVTAYYKNGELYTIFPALTPMK
jgi:hypothetical protein